MALRIWSFVALTSLLATAACHDGGGDPADSSPVVAVPRGAELPPFAIKIAPVYTTAAGFLPRPTELDGHVYLRVDPAGLVTGALSLTSGGQAFLAEVTGRVDDETIVLDTNDVFAAASARLQWSELRLHLFDGDGDGVIDDASGDLSGALSESNSEFFEVSPYTAALTAAKDTTASSATIFDGKTRLPFGLVTIDFGEPVRAEQVALLHVLADGRPVAGSFDAAPVAGLITSMRFHPEDFLPFDQAISLDLGGLTDPSGNAITAAASTLRVIADPSPATGNLGFEDGLHGWTVVGHAQSTGSFGGIAPVEGSSQAVIDAVGTLAGYLDVPADASALHFSLARLSQLDELADNYTATIALHRANGDTITRFDARDATEKPTPCTACAPTYGFQLGPLTGDLDLTQARGERVWLTIDATSFFFIGVPALSVIVDDLRIVTSK
ncbi:MAG: hypothetical protein ABIY55_12290 [Kofleriaceae bacterium]